MLDVEVILVVEDRDELPIRILGAFRSSAARGRNRDG